MIPGAILNQEEDGMETGPSLRLVTQQAVRSLLSEMKVDRSRNPATRQYMTGGGPLSRYLRAYGQ